MKTNCVFQIPGLGQIDNRSGPWE